MENHDEIRNELIQTDLEFRRLYQEHQNRERRLDELTRHPMASPEAELTLKTIKIQKLRLKDQMEEKIQHQLHRAPSA